MPLHHLNCASMAPPLAPPMVAHVLLIERPDGLTLVDTGFGTADIADPGRLGKPFQVSCRPALSRAETALAQVEARGFAAADVTDIVLTHLDLDHAGGIGDFPNAVVHVHAKEYAAIQAPPLRERARYVQAQWAHGPRWEQHTEGGDDWFGFASTKVISDDHGGVEVVLIPLHGHTRGHSGVAVRREDGRWLLHAGDAYFAGPQMDPTPSCPPALKAFQRLMGVDNRARLANLERLHELATTHGDEVTVFCAHDKAQFEALRG